MFYIKSYKLIELPLDIDLFWPFLSENDFELNRIDNQELEDEKIESHIFGPPYHILDRIKRRFFSQKFVAPGGKMFHFMKK